MKRLFVLFVLASLLAGCLADRDLPGLRPKFATLDAAQPLVTPGLIKECSDRVAKEVTYAKVAGSFFLSAKAAGRFNDLEELWPKDNIVALIAPTTGTNLFGGESKSFAGCSYRLENGSLVFHKMHGPTSFGPKVIVY